MLLLIDLGNSRLKWGTLDDFKMPDKIRAQAPIHYQSETLVLQLKQAWSKISAPDAILLSNVVNPQLNRVIEQVCQQLWQMSVTSVQTPKQQGAVRNAYAEAHKLGVDRWLALCAAHALHPEKQCLVVDCGTAMTLDVVRASGQHLGGWIVPGAARQWQQAQQSAKALRHLPDQLTVPRRLKLAQDTQSGVTMGIVTALISTIERAYEDYVTPHLPAAACVLTGGDGAALLPHLRVPCQLREDLVLRGLVYAYQTPARTTEF